MCNIGQLEFRHILVRFYLFEDYVQFLSRSVGYIKDKGDEFFFRTFPWTIGFNPKEETSKSVVWISLPDLPPNFFAKKSLLSIASAVGKPLAVDEATQDQTRRSAARVKILLDLLDKHPKRVKLHIVDKSTGKFVEHYQEVVYDNLPKFCTFCKHQGHEERTCRLMAEKDKESEGVGTKNMGVQELPVVETTGVEKLQGDTRAYLNAKRAGQKVNELLDSNSGQLEVEAPKENSAIQQVSQTDGGNLVNRPGNGTAIGEVSMIDKGPPKPSQPIDDRAEDAAEIGNVVNGVEDGNRGSADVEQILPVLGGNVDGEEFGRIASVFEGKKENMVKRDAPAKSKIGANVKGATGSNSRCNRADTSAQLGKEEDGLAKTITLNANGKSDDQ
uniref:DUF4283 domain-containing protein n=1 Tax=Nicotiana tabacum TaxID=4097 RepID=A0A1S4A672_TOBAC|nr:PREDICTED: uncharacterized protein LOC107794165 [Nicotiana tabacum]